MIERAAVIDEERERKSTSWCRRAGGRGMFRREDTERMYGQREKCSGGVFGI